MGTVSAEPREPGAGEQRLSVVRKERNFRTLREASLLRQLRHQCIAEPVEVAEVECDGAVCLEFKFPVPDLGTAQHVLTTSYPQGLAERAILYIATRVLAAIEYLHERHIIHRAVKAGNVWLESGGTVKLADLSHAINIRACNKWIGEEDIVYEFDESLEDVLIWLAPEVLKQDLHGYGTKSDVYSVGILCCELGNGFPPFAEMEPVQLLYEKVHGSTPFLIDSTTSENGGEYDSDGLDVRDKAPFSAALHGVVNKCLAYAPDERPSATDLLGELRGLGSTVENSENLLALLPNTKLLELIGGL